MKIYTRTGDEGQTGLLYGGRVWKDDFGPEAYGAVDEAVSALGVVRALAGDDLAAHILSLQRDLFVVGAELATNPSNRAKLEPGVSRATDEMVERLERLIDTTVAQHPLPQEFVVPGENPLEAALELAEFEDTVRLAAAAAELRDRGHGNVVTYSRKVFIPLTYIMFDFRVYNVILSGKLYSCII